MTPDAYLLAAFATLGLVVLVLIGLVIALQRAHAAERRRWSEERERLLTRITHPHLLPGEVRVPRSRSRTDADEAQLERERLAQQVKLTG